MIQSDESKGPLLLNLKRADSANPVIAPPKTWNPVLIQIVGRAFSHTLSHLHTTQSPTEWFKVLADPPSLTGRNITSRSMHMSLLEVRSVISVLVHGLSWFMDCLGSWTVCYVP